MVVPPGNRRGSDLRRTCSVRRKVRGPRTPGRTARSAVAAGGSCIIRVRIGDYESLKEAAIDPYVASRDAYLQKRQRKVAEARVRPDERGKPGETE